MKALKPSASLLCKLGSIAVHVDELLSADGHSFDRDALQTLLTDVEITEWLAEMRKAAMVPEKRRY